MGLTVLLCVVKGPAANMSSHINTATAHIRCRSRLTGQTAVPQWSAEFLVGWLSVRAKGTASRCWRDTHQALPYSWELPWALPTVAVLFMSPTATARTPSSSSCTLATMATIHLEVLLVIAVVSSVRFLLTFYSIFFNKLKKIYLL